MTAIVNSQLNPLAIAFIPTNSELSASKKASQYSIEDETETTWERRGEQNSNDLKSINKITPDLTIKLDYRYILWKDAIFGSVSSVLNLVLGNKSQTDLPILGGSQLPMLPECLSDDKKLEQKSKPDITLPKILEEDKDECNCPPMFGWIIPPDFIGNPFNFKYECSKKYPHSPNCTVKSESDVNKLDYLDTEINQWTLEECFTEMKDILADVYETISVDSDPITKWDEKYKIQDYLELSDSDSSDEEGNESNGFGTEFKSMTEIEPELVDDGVHPLLQSRPIAYEDEKASVENVKKILKSLSSPLPVYLNAVTSGVGAACNPPCSQWCASLPSAAKDSFEEYVQKSGNAYDYKECPQRSSTYYRPLFKRSLSANDAPGYDRICQSLSHTSDMDSREMLLLRRKDPLNYIKMQSSDTLTKGKKHGSCDLTDQQLLASSITSSMWGKFDAADSLWQPLPECNPVNTHNQKLNLKKGREIKRRRTMS